MKVSGNALHKFLSYLCNHAKNNSIIKLLSERENKNKTRLPTFFVHVTHFKIGF